MATTKKHNLNFTDEEMGVKAERLSADTPKVKHNIKPKKQMKIKDNLKFEEDKPKPSERFMDHAGDASRQAVRRHIHRKLDNDADDNSSVEAANKGAELTEESVHRVRTYERRQGRKISDKSTRSDREEKQRLKEEKSRLKDEKKIDNEIIDNLYDKYKETHPESGSNPYSKWKQKQEIKKQYYAAKNSSTSTATTVSSVGDKVKNTAKRVADESKTKLVEYVSSHKGAFIAAFIVLGLVLGVAMIGSTGGLITQGGTGAISFTTYPSEDAEMIAANDYYTSLENQLQNMISNYRSTHSYDEYHFNIDPINHDPYELTSLLTAKSGDAYTANSVKSFEANIYAKQYSLVERVEKETRYRTETRYGQYTTTDSEGNIHVVVYSYEVQVPYDYYICYVTLENNGIEAAASSLLDSDQYDMYEIYNETKGNREDLFP